MSKMLFAMSYPTYPQLVTLSWNLRMAPSVTIWRWALFNRKRNEQVWGKWNFVFTLALTFYPLPRERKSQTTVLSFQTVVRQTQMPVTL
jgi:hypothetical protein